MTDEESLQELAKLIELEPRLGAWLEKHDSGRTDQRSRFWVQGWAAHVFAEALIAGDQAEIDSFRPFLEAIEKIASSDPAANFESPGDKFALHLDQALKYAPHEVEW